MQPVEFRAVLFLLRGLPLTVTGFCGGLFAPAGEHEAASTPARHPEAARLRFSPLEALEVRVC